MMSPHILRGSLKEVSLLKLFFEKDGKRLHACILTESEQLGEAFR